MVDGKLNLDIQSEHGVKTGPSFQKPAKRMHPAIISAFQFSPLLYHLCFQCVQSVWRPGSEFQCRYTRSHIKFGFSKMKLFCAMWHTCPLSPVLCVCQRWDDVIVLKVASTSLHTSPKSNPLSKVTSPES